MRAAAAALFVVSLLLASPASAQWFDDGPVAAAGLEFRSIGFERLASARRVRQVAAPIGISVPLGRFSLDLGTAWTSTRLVRPDGTAHSVSDFVDTQIRGAYTFGRDAVVATLGANLPTGPRAASARDYIVIGSVSPAFFAFPVPAYASGFSVTGGLAGAMQTGAWSVGLAGSLRLSGRFTPYQDATGPITYKPGLEGRARIGADGLVGSSRLTFGLTYSTFGTDEFGAGGTISGEYQPGQRIIVEAGLLSSVGSSALSVNLWNFYRTAGDTSGVSAGNRENLTGGTALLSIPATRSLAIEPVLEGRLFKPQSGSGRWLGAGLGFRFQVVEAVSLRSQGRYDRGSVKGPSGVQSDLSGWYGSAYVRVAF